ncbi:MAG: glycosyltransferase family 39 protein [Candidatus Omnitrophota bacterium]|nr:glycosyltransferase family 39 protein [Candidatus Omnitrophota bacterium]
MKKGVYLFLIIAGAFIVRAVGIGYGLPFVYHDDEPLLVNYALAYGTGDFNPHSFNFAPLLTYILFFVYGIFFIIGHIFGYFHTLKDFAYLYLNDPTYFYIIGRGLYGLICGTLSVFFLFVLGKKYFNISVGLLASLFLAFNFLHVRDSHYLYFDIPLVLCILLFFIKAYDFFAPAKKLDYILLGALLGLAVSVKYQGIYLVVPFSAIILYNLRLSKDMTMRIKMRNLLLCAASCGVIIFISNPFLFLDLSAFIKMVGGFPYMPVSPLYHLKISLFNGCGTLMILSGIFWLISSFVRKDKSILIAVYVILYYLFIIKLTQPGERLVLPLVPFLLLFAAAFVIAVCSVVKGRLPRFFAIVLMTILLAYPSLARIYYSDLLFLREDTRTEAYRWIKANVEPKTKIALDAVSSGFPRLEKDREQVKEMKKYFGSTSFGKPENADQAKLEFMLSNPLYPSKTYYLFYLRDLLKRGFLSIYPCVNVQYKEVQDKGVDYVVLSKILTEKEHIDFVEDIERHAVCVKTFSPYRERVSRVESMEYTTVPAAAFSEKELFDRKSYGPYIKIYKINKIGR